jgi:hypothetical protein
MTKSSRYCPRKRIRLTDQQLRESRAPCHECGKALRLVPNRATKEATLATHTRAEQAPAPAPARVSYKLSIAKVSGQLEFS